MPDQRQEFLRIRDTIVEKIVNCPGDLFKLAERLMRLEDHLQRFAFLKLYKVEEDDLVQVHFLASKLVDKSSQERRALISETLENLRIK